MREENEVNVSNIVLNKLTKENFSSDLNRSLVFSSLKRETSLSGQHQSNSKKTISEQFVDVNLFFSFVSSIVQDFEGSIFKILKSNKTRTGNGTLTVLKYCFFPNLSIRTRPKHCKK